MAINGYFLRVLGTGGGRVEACGGEDSARKLRRNYTVVVNLMSFKLHVNGSQRKTVVKNFVKHTQRTR